MTTTAADFLSRTSKLSTTRMVTMDRPRTEECPGTLVRRVLFLPPNPERKGEGGLRTRGYFKRGLADKPLVTVITIVYNRVEYIASTIESVLGQSYENVEYIVIDGGSTDGTLEAIRGYDDAIDYWVSEPDRGISDAFNKGVIASSGTWVNFMNCADTFAAPDVVEAFVRHVDDNADIIFGRGNVVDDEGNVVLTAGRPFDQRDLYRRMAVPHQSAFHHCRYFQQYGLFDTKFQTSMVYEFLLRKRPLSTVFFDTVVSNMLQGGVHEAEDYRRLKEYRMIKRQYCLDIGWLTIEFDYTRALLRALIKRALIRVGLESVVRRIRRVDGGRR